MAIVEVYLIEAPSEEGAVTEGDWGSSSVNECYFLQVTVKSKFEALFQLNHIRKFILDYLSKKC